MKFDEIAELLNLKGVNDIKILLLSLFKTDKKYLKTINDGSHTFSEFGRIIYNIDKTAMWVISHHYICSWYDSISWDNDGITFLPEWGEKELLFTNEEIYDIFKVQ